MYASLCSKFLILGLVFFLLCACKTRKTIPDLVEPETAEVVSKSSHPDFILPGDEQYIRITGRVTNHSDSAAIYWPGTSVIIRFNGDALVARLNDDTGKSYFNIIIDGDSVRYIRLDSTKRLYTLASGLPVGEHTVELIKRNESQKGKTWFYGFKINNGAPLSLPPDKTRAIEIFGNSITAGYAIDDNTGGDSPDSIYTNNYYTYGAITARYFNADYYCTARSGVGIMVSWFPLIMPEIYDRLDPHDPTAKWDFNRVQAHIVVINLLQNDSWLVNMPEHESFKQRFNKAAPDARQIIEAYKNFVIKIRMVYPDAHIICALGSMDATKKNSPWPGYVAQAVTEINDKRMYTLNFPYTEKKGHPRRDDNEKMAKQLITFIEKNIEW